MATSVQPILLDSTGKQIVAQLQNVATAILNSGSGGIPENLNDASWSQISALLGTGNFSDYYSVGDVKGVPVKFSNDTMLMPAVLVGIDTYAENTADFIFLSTFEGMNPSAVAHHNNAGSADSSFSSAPSYGGTGRSALFYNGYACPNHANNPLTYNANNYVFNKLPDDLKSVIVSKTAKYLAFTKTDTTVTLTTVECSNKLWIPTYYEITGHDYSSGSSNDKISSKYQHHYNISNLESMLPISKTYPSFIQYLPATDSLKEEDDVYTSATETDVPIQALVTSNGTFANGSIPSSTGNMAPLIYGFTVGVPSPSTT